MAKILCVLYPDPVTGYPPKYARDDIPTSAHYQTVRPRPHLMGHRDSNRGNSLAAYRANWACEVTSKGMVTNWSSQVTRTEQIRLSTGIS